MLASLDLKYPTINSQLVNHTPTNHTFTVQPLLPGFGYTIGNSIRRFLLSSVPGVAVTRVRINNLTHEYQIIEGVVEDALDVILNLKLLCCNITSDEDKATLKLSVNKEGSVTAASFDSHTSVIITNPDLYICSLNKGYPLELEVEVSRGVGYLHLEDINLAGNINPQDILVDALFSPVTAASIKVEQVRVGDKTNYDKLDVNFETDGSVSPSDIVNFILHNLIELFSKIESGLAVTPSKDTVKALPTTINTETPIESDIQLSPRIKSILDKNGINTNDQLLTRLAEVSEFTGITEKSLKSIQEYVNDLN